MQDRVQLLNDLMVLGADKMAVKTAAYSMTVRDALVKATADTAAFAITLPNVLEAKGKMFLIRAVNAGLTNAITVQDNNESVAWVDILLTGPNQFVLLLSTGESWEVVAGKYFGSNSEKDPYRIVETFQSRPQGQNITGAAATGTTGTTNLMCFQGGNMLEYHIKGTQTILVPQLAATGLDIAMDQTDDDGVEICAGILAVNRGIFIVGTTPAFFMRVKFSIGDVSGTDDCAVGFRKAEAYQGNLDDYADMAALNVISGNITIETIVGGAGTTSTDTTDNFDDGETHTLEVRVSAAGVVTYKIDDEAPTTVAAFSFTAADVVTPFIFMLNASDLADTVILKHFECGLQ